MAKKRVVMQVVYEWELETDSRKSCTELAQEYSRWQPDVIMGYDNAKLWRVTTAINGADKVTLREETDRLFVRKP